jgi:hypothetical protein
MPRHLDRQPPGPVRFAMMLCVALWLAATAPSVAAHVNRAVGPYTIVVFLVEEPVYQDNHAGFEFWVRRDAVALRGLEQDLHAQATGHGRVLDLVIDPIDASGFYVIDHAPDGSAFDPLGGGDWTLTLTGSIEATQIDVAVPVRFPSYPRVGPATQPVLAGTSADTTGPPSWVILLLAGAAAGLLGLMLISRRLSRRRGR